MICWLASEPMRNQVKVDFSISDSLRASVRLLERIRRRRAKTRLIWKLTRIVRGLRKILEGMAIPCLVMQSSGKSRLIRPTASSNNWTRMR